MSRRVDEDAIPSERRGRVEESGGIAGGGVPILDEYYEDDTFEEPNYTHFELTKYIRQKRMGISFTRDELIELLYG